MNLIGLFLKNDARKRFVLNIQPNISLWYLIYDGETLLKSGKILEILDTKKLPKSHTIEGDYIKSNAYALSIKK